MNPERCFKYTVPVTAVAFSNENSQLLAIGFYDGSIRIVDITIADACNLVAISDRKTSPPIEPIWQMKWIKCKRILSADAKLTNLFNFLVFLIFDFLSAFWLLQMELTVRNSEEELLTISQDGFVMLYTITSNTFLIGCRQMQISLNEADPLQLQANRCILRVCGYFEISKISQLILVD